MYLSESYDIYYLPLYELDRIFNITKLLLKFDIVTGIGGIIGRYEEYGIKFEVRPNDREKDKHAIAYAHVTYRNVTKDISIKDQKFYNAGFNSKIDKHIIKLIKDNKEGIMNF